MHQNLFKFYNSSNIPQSPWQVVFAKSKTLSIIIAVIFFLITSCFLWIGFCGGLEFKSGGIPGFIAYWIGCVFGILFLIQLSMTKAVLKTSNWLIKFSPHWMVIKFRSFWNHHFDAKDVQAFGFSPKYIEWVRPLKETLKTPGSDGGTKYKMTWYLEIALKDADFPKLIEALKEERVREAPKKGMSRTKFIDNPVLFIEPNIIRIQWVGMNVNINKAVKILGRSTMVKSALKTTVDYTNVNNDQQKDQQKAIVDLWEKGEKIAALRLVRRTHKMSLKDAKAYLESL